MEPASTPVLKSLKPPELISSRLGQGIEVLVAERKSQPLCRPTGANFEADRRPIVQLLRYTAGGQLEFALLEADELRIKSQLTRSTLPYNFSRFEPF
jgi:hypothetical protein